MNPKYFTLKKVREILKKKGRNYSLSYLRYLAKTGKLKAEKIANEWLISRKSLRDFIKAQGSRLKAQSSRRKAQSHNSELKAKKRIVRGKNIQTKTNTGWVGVSSKKERGVVLPLYFGWQLRLILEKAQEGTKRVFWPFKKHWQAKVATLLLGAIAFTSIFFLSNSLIKAYNLKNSPNIPVEIYQKGGKIEQSLAKLIQTEQGFNIEIDNSQAKIEIFGIKQKPQKLFLFLDKPSLFKNDNGIKTNIFALLKPNLQFEKAKITLKKPLLNTFKKVNALLSCPTWAFNKKTGECQDWQISPLKGEDKWTKITFETTHFSAYAGAYLEILNVQTNLTKGDTWTVKFQTYGKSDLTIKPVKGTKYSEDLQFLGFYCGNNRIDNVFDGQTIFIKDYQCNEISKIENKALTGGPHYLEFTFGKTKTQAHNFACDSGTLDTTCYVTTQHTMANGDVISGTGNSGGELTAAAGDKFYINMGGDIWIYGTSSLAKITGNFEATSTNFTIENASSSINVTGKGYAGGGSGAAGSGPGAGSGGTTGGGAGYGGNGGNGYGGRAGGSSYGALTQPTDLGSGGGGGDSCSGGAGGGAVKLNVSGTLTVQGSIIANGNNGSIDGTYDGAGGGSGGSIYIIAGTISGSGTLSADGGNGGSAGCPGGGGADLLYHFYLFGNYLCLWRNRLFFRRWSRNNLYETKFSYLWRFDHR
jgi:hypothetical protein